MVAIIYGYSILSIDTKKHYDYLNTTSINKINSETETLLEINPLNNLPEVKYINTGNQEIDDAQKDALYLGPNIENDNYKCANTLMVITETDEYYLNGAKLKTGTWCVKKQNNCNLRTGYVVSGPSGLVCRTKFPNMFGGNDASKIVACNNEVYPSTSSILWDNRYGEPVNPFTVLMTDENEQLPNGDYRFTCKYTQDEMKNNYLPHPLNRFHPIRNPCTKTIFSAGDSIKMNITPTDWNCDCGDPHISRVWPLNDNNLKLGCSSCVFIKYNDTENHTDYKIPYSCLTNNSPIGKLSDIVPCISEKFISYGNLCDTINLTIHKPYHSIPDTDIGYNLLQLVEYENKSM